MPETLPLFPLSEVLFPGMMLPLHIFEPRYRLMIRRCVSEKIPFGVVLISRGQEVGPGAEFFNVGTTARITRVQRADDGRLYIASVGEQRFRILQTNNDQPYLQGQVEVIPEQPGDSAQLDSLTERALLSLSRYLKTITGSNDLGENLREKDLSPQRLSYTIGTLLQVDRAEKQAILEIPTTTARLEHEIDMMEGELQQLSLLAHSQRQEATPPPFWSLN
ncbi:MAG TPA: LON peptidase substrate-binding domain-containing protein [Chloroflexota bacterium]|nr:LON peptidase substrate-binding domain-containing protein [Chloroflexota bacterium]